MMIPSIPTSTAAFSTPAIAAPGATGGAGGTAAAGASDAGGSFTDTIGDALQALSDVHHEVDQLAVQAATGDLTAIHEFTIATSEAKLMTELTVEIRNRAIEAFNDIMRMQV